MRFDNTTIGLLLFYAVIGLYTLTFAFFYWASKRDTKKRIQNKS